MTADALRDMRRADDLVMSHPDYEKFCVKQRSLKTGWGVGGARADGGGGVSSYDPGVKTAAWFQNRLLKVHHNLIMKRKLAFNLEPCF